MKYYNAQNTITKLWYSNATRAFTESNAQNAAVLEPQQLAVVNATFDNVQAVEVVPVKKPLACGNRAAQMNLPEQLAAVAAGFAPEGLFYDWFCRDSSLPRKADKLLKKAAAIVASPRFVAAEVYVFFKNNCPVHGGLYDDFRVCDVSTGDVLFNVSNDRSEDGPAWTVYGKANDFDAPLCEGSWAHVAQWFNDPAAFADKDRAQRLQHAVDSHVPCLCF